jgi:anti-sigma-K factor RskA
MDYARSDLADRLAAEYALGTLRGRARRRFESLLPAHAGLRGAVTEWQARLAPLAFAVEPVEPSPALWMRLERHLFGGDRGAAPLAWWHRLGLWQGLTAFATVAALSLALVVSQPPPVAPPIVIVLDATADALGAQQARFVASVTTDGRALVLRPLGPVTVDAGRALELWSVPAAGAPRSLGVVSAEQATTVLRARLLENTAAFAVSIEPSGGSPTGAPTGPIVSVGKLDT